MFANKPRILLLNKADLANESVTAGWKSYFEQKGLNVFGSFFPSAVKCEGCHLFG
jgi:ribosome biogenesis GTPase A